MTVSPPLSELMLSTAPGVFIRCYDTGGTGPVMVILHGLAGSAAEFFPTAAALPEFRTILIDQRGHGGSTRFPGDVSREAYVADVVRVIEEAAAGPVTLVGQSMGGHTAMLTAAARPDLVSQLVLLEAGAGGGRPQDHESMGEYFRSWPVPFPSRRAAQEFLGDTHLVKAWVADLEEHADGFRPRFDADVMVQAISSVTVARWQEWEQVSAPTLVVYGGKGMFTEAEKDEFVRRGHDVTRVDLPGASHDAHLDALDEWVAALKKVTTRRRA